MNCRDEFSKKAILLGGCQIVHEHIDINSASWKKLTDDERYVVVDNICSQFAEELGEDSKINYICATETHITVCTSLPHGTRLDSIPMTYHGIPIQQDPILEEMEDYIENWSMILKRIAGWTTSQIGALSDEFQTYFKSPFALHDSPLELITYYLLTEPLRKAASLHGLKELNIGRRIEREINLGLSDNQFCYFPIADPKYDWVAARNRVMSANSELEERYIEEKLNE